MIGKCKETVWGGDGWHPVKRQCKASATCPDGYCKRHSPDEIKRREEEKAAKLKEYGPTNWHDRIVWIRDQEIKQLKARIAELEGK